LSHYTNGSGGHSDIQVKTEIPEPLYPDEGEEGDKPAPRVDIEMINLISDDEDEEPVDKSRKGKGKAVSNKGGLKPVRLHREEHKERVTMVNTEPAATSLPTEDEQPRGGEVRDAVPDNDPFTRKAILQGKTWQGVYQDDDAVQIKVEPSAAPVEQSMPQSPQFKRTARELAASTSKVDPPTSSKSKLRRKLITKEKKPVLQTEEDRAEYSRHLEDVAILADELGGLQTASKDKDGEGDIEMVAPEEDGQVKDKEGRLYLFQFPPILPPLYNPIKKEEDNAETTGAAAVLVEADLTSKDDEEIVVKTEPGNTFVADEEVVKEAGWIGKLVVRESGKVELSWGETGLELGRGVECEFLTTTVITDERDGEGKGEGMGMGRVMGKFVAVPDWAKML
jgi:DNA-directed RNA polymerase III subunit RPC4